MIKNLRDLSRFLRTRLDMTCSLPNKNGVVTIVGEETKGSFCLNTKFLKIDKQDKNIELYLPTPKDELLELLLN
jgi:hypothetical protein